MVTPEERITRLEAILEANAQQSAQILTLLSRILDTVEAARREAQEANEAARREAREDNAAARREAKEANEAARKEAREDNAAVRRDARIWFISLLTLGAALFGTVLGTSLAG